MLVDNGGRCSCFCCNMQKVTPAMGTTENMPTGWKCHGCCQCVVIVGGVAVEEFEIGKGCCQENIMIMMLVSWPIDSDDMCLFLSEGSCSDARHICSIWLASSDLVPVWIRTDQCALWPGAYGTPRQRSLLRLPLAGGGYKGLHCFHNEDSKGNKDEQGKRKEMEGMIAARSTECWSKINVLILGASPSLCYLYQISFHGKISFQIATGCSIHTYAHINHITNTHAIFQWSFGYE